MKMILLLLVLFTAGARASDIPWLTQLEGNWSGTLPDCVVGHSPFYDTKSTQFTMSLKRVSNAVGDMLALKGEMNFIDYQKRYDLFFEQIPQSNKFKVTVTDGAYQRRYITDEKEGELEFKSAPGDLSVVQFTLAKTYERNPKEIQIFLSRKEIQTMESFTCSGVVQK